MLRTHAAFLAIVPLLAVGWSACAVDTETEEDTASGAEATIVLPNPFVFGTYRRERTAHEAGGMDLLVLKSDSTYHRETNVICIKFPCEPFKEDGTFLLRGKLGDRLSLYPATHERPEYYHVTMAGNRMILQGLGMRPTITLVKTPQRSWCEEPADCVLQRLPRLECPGFWACGPETEICSYGCLKPF